jgi:hypothetical protein
MTSTKIVFPENLEHAVGLIKEHLDEALADGNSGGTEHETCHVAAIDAETIDQILQQANFPTT